MLTRKPHYIREYGAMLELLRRRHGDEDAAMQKAVGGSYQKEGKRQSELILARAPEGPFTLLDVGGGSGRAAYALREVERLTYFGVDIMPDLVDYARTKAARPDWRFEVISDIGLPAEDEWADMMLIMSVFTHLKPSETQRYLGEVARVLKPGGVLICSYLDKNNPKHKSQFRPAPLQFLARMLGRDVMLSFVTRAELSQWAEDAGLKVEEVIEYENGRQHTLVARK